MQSGQSGRILRPTSMRQTVSAPQSAHAMAEASTWVVIEIDPRLCPSYRKLNRGALAAGVFQ